MGAHLQLGIFYALLSGTLWGIGPLLLKKGMARSNVSAATIIQQCLSVLTLAAVALLRGELLRPDLSAAALSAFAAAGMVGASFGKIFYYQGIDKVGASKSTSVKNSSPLLTALLSVVILGEELSLAIGVGVTLIVGGIVVLTRVESRGEKRPSPVRYFFYPLMAAFCFGINPVFKKIGVDASGMPALGALITQTTALAVILSAGRSLNIKPKWERVPTKSLIYFSLAGVIEALGSLFTYFALLHAPAILVSPIWRISPLITFLLVRLTLQGIEVVTPRDGVAAAFIVGGVFVLSRG